MQPLDIFTNHIPKIAEGLNFSIIDKEHFNISIFENEIENFKEELVENYLNETYPNYSWESANYKTKDWAICYLTNKNNITSKIEQIIIELYDTCCCVDKTSFLYRAFFDYHFLNKEIDFSNTFYVPNTVDKNEWFKLIFQIMLLESGGLNNEIYKFVEQYQKVKQIHNEIIHSKKYLIDDLKQFIDMVVDKTDFVFEWAFSSIPDPRFAEVEILSPIVEERDFNYNVLSIIQIELKKSNCDYEKINNLINQISISERNNFNEKYPHPNMKLGDLFLQREEHENNIKYYFYIDNFYFYIKSIKQIKQKLNDFLDQILQASGNKNA